MISIVLGALLGGALISILLVMIYVKITRVPFKATNIQSKSQTKHDISTADNSAHDDFDYPYEDIGKVTGI